MTRAVVLAAGVGRRLLPVTRRIPKALLRVGGATLLERSLHALGACGVVEAIVVTGHLREKIEARLGNRRGGVCIRYVPSDRYAETGSMHSLYQARSVIDSDILLLESDLLYGPAALDALLGCPRANATLVGGLLGSGDDVYVCANGRGEIAALGKHVSDRDREAACGALVGISKLSLPFLRRLFARVDHDPRPYPSLCHYEEYVFETSLQSVPIHAVVRRDLVWIEIDTMADLRRARGEILPQLSLSRPPGVGSEDSSASS